MKLVRPCLARITLVRKNLFWRKNLPEDAFAVAFFGKNLREDG